MPTLAQVGKVAKKEIFPLLKPLGFESKGTFAFYRKNGDIYNVITAVVLSSGNNLRLRATCWVPEVNPEIDMSSFPKGMGCLFFKIISWNGLEERSYLWDVKNDEAISSSIVRMKEMIEKEAIPWFDSIATRSDLIQYAELDATARADWPARKARILKINN